MFYYNINITYFITNMQNYYWIMIQCIKQCNFLLQNFGNSPSS